jgi:hypothetical protein
MSLRVLFRRPDTQHRQEHAALVGIDGICSDYASRLPSGAIGQGFDVTEFGGISFRSHDTTLGDSSNRLEFRLLFYPSLPVMVGSLPTVDSGVTAGAASSARPMH